MDQRARFNDLDEVLETLRDAVLNGLHIAIPVEAAEDSSDGHTVKLQSLIKTVRKHPDGREELVDFPPFVDIPIQFASGSGITSTFPIKKKQEGIFLIASRSFDAWHQQSGTQPAVDARRNNLSDGFFIPGVRSNPNKIPNVSSSSAQTRTDDHKTVSDWSDQGVTHAREEAVHYTSAGGIMSALKGALLSVTGKGVAASKGSSSHVVVDGAVSSQAPKVLLNC